MLKSTIDKATGFEKRFENIGTVVFEEATSASKAIALEISNLIKVKQAQKQYCILGLATGSSPKGLYAELVRLHKEEGLSFKNVVSYNLDEYYPMEPDSINSYVRFMQEQLFNHIDILPENCHVPDGTLSKEEIRDYCDQYEARIEAVGGIDLQILGIGGNGHIGFNESGSLQNSKTRLVALDHITRVAASGDFSGLDKTPRTAITLGVKKIMEAKRVILMAWGERKASIIKASIEDQVTSRVPASYLQEHRNATFILDKAAASKLTRINTPWLVEKITWTDKLSKKAVLSLALNLKKPILMLTDADYIENGMSDLLADFGPAYDINIKIFNQLQSTITGWPGGKPNADDTKRPERAEPSKKRILIFSPHPDDDIISMGGTFKRLHEQGHEVHVGYQTSGNIAVADDEALRFASFVCDYNDKFGLENKEAENIYKKAATFLKNKKSSEIDTAEVRYIKGLIRKGEARATSHFVGIPDEQIHFMELPFYETGAVKKNPIGVADVKITAALIEKIKPHQIYAAGDLADPHGTHKVCLDAVFSAVKQLKPNKFMDDCWVWLYRGAWQEWGIDEIEMAVPMGPAQVLEKRKGIFKHQSQKDGVVFQGADSREFWQRAEDRNKETASLYDALGLAHYAAMEAFVRWKF
ncbi:glucosamine-6-phosphate deaminase [Polaribacter glomeratus]|uniref:Glucosamine-6-phosphate deaminase n=1 Tax=Polaribacter glomeratus TaxID=102 RepID=A0A2S7WV75_9FLAO|nr:glucosamine-6-phosphate deaminase [Polaribacter glomeratus]PQJ81261.1 glucosamine-6-phosphate deaminase [Polaribacter glomeratus]TXD65817.1 glucosamine-6-phosphate deaminase [Polaribacter glomeratus]